MQVRKCADCGSNFEAESNETICDDCCYEDDPDTNTEPDFYECLSCGHSCAERPAWGGKCPKCMTQMEEGYF
jgi:hypothetical protein